MHNNYFFIRQVSSRLGEILEGSELIESFSQQKDELICTFRLADEKIFFIHAALGDDFSCIHFPHDFKKATRNTVPVFREIYGRKIIRVIQANNERAFLICFDSSFMLLFKLFGNRSNVLLFENNVLSGIFKKRLLQDRNFQINNIHKESDVSFDVFSREEGNLRRLFPTFDQLMHDYFFLKQYPSAPIEKKWEILSKVLEYLNHPQYYLIMREGFIYLSLFETGEIKGVFEDPIEALNAFYAAHYRYNHYVKIKQQKLADTEKEIRKAEKYIFDCRSRIQEITEAVPPNEIADIIMANLHQIPPQTEHVTLFDFYSNKNISISLKKNVSPQKYAESLYRKSKNKSRELDSLNDRIKAKMLQIENLREEIIKINNAADYKSISGILKQKVKEEKGREDLPDFREFEFKGYRIFVGRNAKNNDELTQKFAHKDDLWLHARDVSGSHVLIRHQAGKNFPKGVIEKAAAIAAFYSGRKNENLCPVIYTSKKNVRKMKGAPAGAVKVEKENVLMVKPEAPDRSKSH